MDNLQFDLEDSPLLSIQSPSIIDVSSDSGEEFVVQPSSLPVIEERFRVGGPRSDMTAFVSATSGTLFASEPENPVVTKIIDTAGTQIERQMMDTIEEHHFSRESSSTSFIDTELEDSPMSPWDTAEPLVVPVNSYGRQTAATLLHSGIQIRHQQQLIDLYLRTQLILQLTTSIFKPNNQLITDINKHTEFRMASI